MCFLCVALCYVLLSCCNYPFFVLRFPPGGVCVLPSEPASASFLQLSDSTNSDAATPKETRYIKISLRVPNRDLKLIIISRGYSQAPQSPSSRLIPTITPPASPTSQNSRTLGRTHQPQHQTHPPSHQRGRHHAGRPAEHCCAVSPE
jgi:hypothetical protein